MLEIVQVGWLSLGGAATSWLGGAAPILAQAADAKKAPAPTPDGFGSMLPALAIIMVMFYFLMIRPQKAKEREFKNLVANLKEKDRVVTIGGIHGVVVNVQPDNEMVTIRVDESTGTKIRVGTAAIARVLTDEEKSA